MGSNILSLVHYLFQIYLYMIIVYAFMSWMPQMRDSKIGAVLTRFVEPYLMIFRRFIPPIGMIDLSVLVALFALHFVEIGVRTILVMLLGAVG